MPSAQALQSAIDLHKAQRFQEAEKAYRQFLRHNDVNPHALRLLGVLYLQTNQKALAAEYLEKAVRFLPNDPETLTNLGIALYGIKRAKDAATRFKQALTNRPDYIPALRNLASLYAEIGQINEAETAFDQLLKRCPAEPQAHFERGNARLNAGKTQEAIADYEKALALNPDYLEAMVNLGIAMGLAGKNDRSQEWLARAQTIFEKALEKAPQNASILNNLGNVLRQQGQTETAATRFHEALRTKPNYAEATINLATCLRDLQRLDEAIATGQSALRLKPDSVEARINLGTFLQENGQHKEAVALFSEALLRKPASIDAQWNKSLSLLALGDYEEGWKLHETGLGIPHMRGAYTPEKRWKGEDLSGKRLLIRAEQGFGDTLQFIRYAENCKKRGATIIVSAPSALHKLFANSSFLDEIVEPSAPASFDFHVPVMSLPYMFGTTLDTIPTAIPYLQVSEATRTRWASKIPAFDALKIGLVWAGNPREKRLAAHLTDKRRSVDLETFMPLFDVSNARFFSLQKGAKTDQIAALGLQEKIIDLMNDVQNFEDTAAIIEHLDLVISVDTSVAHLAGGMGKPVWILSRFDACWRWLQNKPESPWYPTARIFGQPKPGDWASVIESIKTELGSIFLTEAKTLTR